MVTTIDFLPDEVTLKIFLFLGQSSGSRHSQIKVAQVCSHWRKLALSCPLLWTTIHVECCSKWDFRYCSKIGETFFQRSSPRLVDVVIEDRFEGLSLFNFLEPHLSRIRSLDMDAVKVDFSTFKYFLEWIGGRASNLRSLQLPGRQYINPYDPDEDTAMEAPPPIPLQLVNLAFRRATCVECLPFSLSSVAYLELRGFFPTRSGLTSLFSNMPLLSSLAIDISDTECLAGRRHFYFHNTVFDDTTNGDDTADIDALTSNLIPSSSLQKLALHATATGAHMRALGYLDVQNLKHLELHSYYDVEDNLYQPVLKAWGYRLVSLETLVLRPLTLLRRAGEDGETFIHSSHLAGINLVARGNPTFQGYRDILSSFTKIASITYYLPWIDPSGRYTEAPEELKESCHLSFPITFLPLPGWYKPVSPTPEPSYYFGSQLINEQPFSECVDFIRHFVKLAKGGDIPVLFSDSPVDLPRVFYHTQAQYPIEEDEEHVSDDSDWCYEYGGSGPDYDPQEPWNFEADSDKDEEYEEYW